jgi:CelD/BcsL family acetyltransferase involved in cellulose biosynthesis
MSAAQITASRPVFITDAASMAPGALVNGAAQCVNPIAQPDWDAMVAKHPHGSFFHSAAWASVLADTYGYAPNYFVVRESGEFRALLPLMEVDSWLTGRRGVSLPFTDECEPLFADEDSFKNLVSSALAMGRARGWKYLELRGGRKCIAEAPASLAFHSHTLDLTGDEETIFGRVDASVRRAIRKAEKEGVRVEFSEGIEAVRDFYSLFCRTRKKHGLPPQPFAFFENIHRHVISQKLGTVALARHEGVAVAGAVYFNLGGKAIYKFGASDESSQHLRGNNLVMWEAIRHHARMGCRTMDLGRTSLGNEGLRRFKLGWGAREKQTEYMKFDLRRNGFLKDKDESSGWHTGCFKVMPVWASKMVGATLYRHWA